MAKTLDQQARTFRTRTRARGRPVYLAGFPARLVTRGSPDIELVISDCHNRLVTTIDRTMLGVSRLRCHGYLLTCVHRSAQPFAVTLMRTLSEQPDTSIHAQHP